MRGWAERGKNLCLTESTAFYGKNSIFMFPALERKELSPP